MRRQPETNTSCLVFVLPFFVIHKVQMRRAMMIGLYSALSLGAVDIAFSLARFLTVQLTHAGDFRSITTIGTLSPFYSV
jgi:ABC-type nickel/cobalt efflux system permease component RcnA